MGSRFLVTRQRLTDSRWPASMGIFAPERPGLTGGLVRGFHSRQPLHGAIAIQTAMYYYSFWMKKMESTLSF